MAGLTLGLGGVGLLSGLGRHGSGLGASAWGAALILAAAHAWALGTIMASQVTLPVIAVLLGVLILNERLTRPRSAVAR
jgi:drug/metabolite transporter (DMT)-like permease